MFTNPKNILSEKEHGFTLIELIVVIIIVGILAAVGMTQYTLIVEKARTAEAKVRIGAMRTLAYNYYLVNGSLTGMQNADLGVDNTCVSTGYFRFTSWVRPALGVVWLYAYRCAADGKVPSASRLYRYCLRFFPATGWGAWGCTYLDDSSSCFGLSACLVGPGG